MRSCGGPVHGSRCMAACDQHQHGRANQTQASAAAHRQPRSVKPYAMRRLPVRGFRQRTAQAVCARILPQSATSAIIGPTNLQCQIRRRRPRWRVRGFRIRHHFRTSHWLVDAQSSVALPLALALELSEGQAPSQQTLSRDQAAELAALIASDLHALIPAVDAARLALAGSLLDSVELLRPGFPIWATLDELARRAPRGHLDNVVAFGSHAGQMPAPVLEPSPAFAEGPLRLIPMSLLAPPELAEALSDQLEDQLIGRGEAGEHTADWLMRTLEMRLDHARYLTRNDVLAMASAQYASVNLAALWQLLETALLAPEQVETVMSARGLPLRFADGRVLAQSPARWLAAHSGDGQQRAHDFAGILFELRQYAVLLDAHRVPLHLQPAPGAENAAGPGFLLEMRDHANSDYEPPELFAQEAPGLGIVAVTVAQRGAGDTARVLAHGYPLRPEALGSLLAALADHYTTRGSIQALGRVWLDADGALGAPATLLH